jgi:phosphotransferase family enzyme
VVEHFELSRMVTSACPAASATQSDPGLPTLAAALDPVTAEAALRDRLVPAIGLAALRLRSARVAAYKPGRRCLVEYELAVTRCDGSTEHMAVLGKMRANRFGNSGYRQLLAFWTAGFGSDSTDGISVPEPIGTIPALRMWLQRKIHGQVATGLLPGAGGAWVAERIAAAVQKLHAAGVVPERRHTIADELRILERCLRGVASTHSSLAARLHRLAGVAYRAGAMLGEPAWCGSHRDFYADQVLVAGQRLFLIDFDLYCEADPGLDVGNFLGHVTEYGLRTLGSAYTLAGIEQRLEDCFVALAGNDVRWSVRVYAALTIARHVYLNTRFHDRAYLTGMLLSIAEQRLAAVLAEGGLS